MNASPPRGGTILLVDDDPAVRHVAAQMLDGLGFKVLTAADGREGLEVFRQHDGEMDCVILDLTMPEMGGEEVFRELRRLRSDLCVILSSGYNEEDVTQRFVGQGLGGVHPEALHQCQAAGNSESRPWSEIKPVPSFKFQVPSSKFQVLGFQVAQAFQPVSSFEFLWWRRRLACAAPTRPRRH